MLLCLLTSSANGSLCLSCWGNRIARSVYGFHPTWFVEVMGDLAGFLGDVESGSVGAYQTPGGPVITHLLERYSRLLLRSSSKTSHFCFFHKLKRQTAEIFLNFKFEKTSLFFNFILVFVSLVKLCSSIIGHHLRPTPHPRLLCLGSSPVC